MRNEDSDYRWMKYKNGKSYFAVVNLEIEKNEAKNEIIENYSGNGYSNHMIDVGKDGMETWKEALISGLTFSLLHSNDFWKITINGLYGKPMTDTNPTIVGYTGIQAFLERTKVIIDKNHLEKIEHFVYQSWENSNSEKVPDFNQLSFQ